MFKRVVSLFLACSASFVAGCGEDKSPAGPNPPGSLPIASTPERFVALLDSVIGTMDLALYSFLLDSSYQFVQEDWSVAPGEPCGHGLSEGWEGSEPTFEWHCPSLHAGTLEEADVRTLPWLGATIKYKVVRADTYVSLEVDAANSGWASVDFTTGGSFLDMGGAELRVGRPANKPSSWGSTKSLFR
jgi:hypothetical protein